MSNNNFVKGECRRCAGHLEFPADAAGQTIPCPHCGQPTELVAPVLTGKTSGSGRMRWGIAAATVLVVVAGLAAAIYLKQKAGRLAASENLAAPATPSNTSNAPALTKVVRAYPPGEERTNDFAISAIKLQKMPDTSLVYVIGNVRNLDGRQRFGVKVEFGLFDTNNHAVGTATDYQQMIDPNGDWQFKALVMDSKAASSARFNSIHEEPQ
jgi:hypothetical protein